MSNNSITPGIKSRSWFHDGFHIDEFHATLQNPNTNCRLSRFSVIPSSGGNPKFDFRTAALPLPNPLEDSALVNPAEVTTGNSDAGKPQVYMVFVPSGVMRKAPKSVRLCLFFGPPGPVMNRQGLRTFFEKQEIALITLAGTENTPKFGFGITPGQIDQLLAKAMEITAPGAGSWTIEVLAGYSTGFRGMNRSILGLFSDAQLANVKKLIYFDCLYRHDKPAPGENTFHAMERVLKNSPGAKFVIYDLTGNATDDVNQIVGGTPHKASGGFWNKWPKTADPLDPKTNTVTEVIGFKGSDQRLAALEALALARLVEGGLEDGYFDRNFVTSTFGANAALLIDAVDKQLKPRGSYASNTALATAKGKTFVGDWLTPKSDIAKLVALAGKMQVPVIDKFKLLGWAPTVFLGDVAHDSHVPEFGWEHLLG